ncbi:MAG TPA: acetamidase/formamidase family protein [Spirochaetia bacterium]|nr:acetamidase/formamidase family protein [Spirochaetia bacterium]HTZ52470.1 acetamidase/formamidase family protein [Spirochaetia bacterium]
MPVRVSRDHVFFAFSSLLPPAARVRQGEEVTFETHDCFQGQITSERDLISSLDWSHVNPATGPVFVEGAHPGDVLRVDLLEIKVADKSVMVTIPGEGALGTAITKMETAVLRIENDTLVFKGTRLPVRPMIGVIGVAPARGEVPNGTPGPHGGNMDCTLIRQGASLYLRVGVEGALFGAGDLHAGMGDGEIVVCGAETEGTVRFTAQVVDLPGLPTPFVENEDTVAVIAAAVTADEAASLATHRMASFLTDLVHIPLNEAGMLMSLAGRLAFCQIVDPLKTVRFEFPKSILADRGFSLRSPK